jgi:hypothetical protein
MCYELSREADSDEVLTALVHVTAIPVRDSIRILLSASCWMNRSFGTHYVESHGKELGYPNSF